MYTAAKAATTNATAGRATAAAEGVTEPGDLTRVLVLMGRSLDTGGKKKPTAFIRGWVGGCFVF